MAGEKIFIGPKLRELRNNRGLTQVQLASKLGVSASYVNLVERNQRSASLKFLVSLSDAFGLNWREFTKNDSGTILSDLRQMTRDPAFGETLPDIEELRSALDGSPNLVKGMFNIYNAYRSYGQRLAEQNEAAAFDDPTLNVDQSVHDFFRKNNNYFHDIDVCAEEYFVQKIPDRREIYSALRSRLTDHLGVRVRQVRVEDLGAHLRHYDPKTKILSLSDGLDHTNQIFQLAHMIALIEFPELLFEQLPAAMRDNARATSRCRVELANYFAAAVMMPYGEFLEEARAVKYDIDRLAARYTVSYEQACQRLTTLPRPGNSGIPFFFLRIDRGGNVSKRLNATPIQLARYGGACPRLDVHYCFRVPGRILTQIAEMPDHSRYLTINRTVDRPAVRYSTEDKRLSVSLGCAIEHAHETIYGDVVNASATQNVTEIGINCRLCPRKNCEQRAHDPFFTDLKLDENIRGATHFES